jgi:hypothetical protein
MTLPLLFDNYIQISDVYRKDLAAYLFGDILQKGLLLRELMGPQHVDTKKRSRL